MKTEKIENLKALIRSSESGIETEVIYILNGMFKTLENGNIVSVKSKIVPDILKLKPEVRLFCFDTDCPEEFKQKAIFVKTDSRETGETLIKMNAVHLLGSGASIDKTDIWL